MRDVALVTVARSDWGIYRPVLRELAKTPGLAVRVLASGMHLSERFGMTAHLVEEEAASFGVPVERVPMEMTSDSPVDVAAAMGAGMTAFGRSFDVRRPDILLVLGDRFEMFSAVAAAVPFVVPVFHIHGGERTAGAIDDALRHAMTKMSHMHFVSTPDYGRRVRQLGEDSWRIVVSGAPALDELRALPAINHEALGARLGIDLAKRYILVGFHPTTLESGAARSQGESLVAALEESTDPVIFMMPNADPGGQHLRELIMAGCLRHGHWRWVENLQFVEFAHLMMRAAVFVGNSSSGIIEAPTLGVPVVNVGRRQEGRVRAKNVIDVEPHATGIAAAIRVTSESEWRNAHLDGKNPYDAGGASQIIARTIVEVGLDARLVNKGFIDLPVPRRRRAVVEFSITQEATLRDVVRCIDANRTGMAVVIDHAGHLVDVVTDGDVRRALLAGAILDDSVQVLAHRRTAAPRTGDRNGTEDEWCHIMEAARIRQLPILDAGVVVDLVLIDELKGAFPA